MEKSIPRIIDKHTSPEEMKWWREFLIECLDNIHEWKFERGSIDKSLEHLSGLFGFDLEE
jgi:hypothetical protein